MTRLLILLAGLALASGAFADQQHDIRVNRIEMKATAPDEGDDAEESKETETRTKAQDYNSSRSNTTTAIDTDDDGDSVDTEECTDSVDDDCTGRDDEAPANHNTTRSKR